MQPSSAKKHVSRPTNPLEVALCKNRAKKGKGWLNGKRYDKEPESQSAGG